MPLGYDLGLTVVSLLAAAAVTGAGFAVSAEIKASWAAPVGGAIFGLGVAVMHYTGMSALEVPGHLTWSLGLVLASIALGVSFGIAALYVVVRGSGVQPTLVSALFLTLSIVTHHFTAMGAVEIVPDPTISIAALSLSPLALSMTIASAAIAVLGISLVAALAGSSRQQLVASSDAEIGKQVERLEAAMTNMSQGLAMFDRDRKMVICNDRYVQLYGLSPEQVKPGTPLAEIVETRIANGVFAFKDAEQYRNERLAPHKCRHGSRL